MTTKRNLEKLLNKEDDTTSKIPFPPLSKNKLAEIIKKDPFAPAEKYLTLFSEEWNDYFRRFDDSIIPIFQYFHLKKSGSILNKIFGGLSVIFAYITTCTIFLC